MTHARSSADLAVADIVSRGHDMHRLASELFPLTRSLTGAGYRRTLELLEAVSGPMQRHRFATGERVLDWQIPPEWTIRDAWIKAPDGSTVVTLAECNLHVVGYSTPVHRRLALTELQQHLHSLPEQPTAIPYRTSYYAGQWGFCLTDEQRRTLPDGEYEVLIDADLGPGAVELGEVVFEGSGDGEVLLWTYCCHPSMANNELSGPVVAAHLAALLRELAASGEASDRAERDARAATAQARFTAWVVLGLPLAGALLAELASPGFAVSLVATPLSAWFAFLAALLQLTALVCIGRLAGGAR